MGAVPSDDANDLTVSIPEWQTDSLGQQEGLSARLFSILLQDWTLGSFNSVWFSFVSGAKSLFSGLSTEAQATVVGRRPDRDWSRKLINIWFVLLYQKLGHLLRKEVCLVHSFESKSMAWYLLGYGEGPVWMVLQSRRVKERQKEVLRRGNHLDQSWFIMIFCHGDYSKLQVNTLRPPTVSPISLFMNA